MVFGLAALAIRIVQFAIAANQWRFESESLQTATIQDIEGVQCILSGMSDWTTIATTNGNRAQGDIWFRMMCFPQPSMSRGMPKIYN